MVFSPYLVALVLAWMVAHLAKGAIAAIKGRQISLWHQLFISGGMPSAHAATSLAVWMVVLMKDGVDSGLFGLATLVALIICYDAVRVRRAVGQNAELLESVIDKSKLNVKRPMIARGHTPFEVAIGAVVGVIIGFVVVYPTI